MVSVSRILIQHRPRLTYADLPAIALDAQVSSLLDLEAPVAIGVSGGKDSQAAALASVAYLDHVGHRGPRILVRSDLGMVEWADSLPVCQALADHLGLELLVLRRAAGGMMERWEARWASSRARYEALETVTLVLPWSTPDKRFCTSELKTHLIAAALRRRWPGRTIVNVTGIRREESVRRAKGAVASLDEATGIMDWRPLSDWTLRQTLDCVAASGLALHLAYRVHRMSRVSCAYCIMSNASDLQHASAAEETHGLYRRMVQLEIDSSFSFQGTRWLGDVRTELLSPQAAQALVAAKAMAASRIALEAAITPAMRFVKKWPTRMLTNPEADCLAGVRRGVAEMFGLNARHTTRSEIHDHYAALIAAKAAKAAREAAVKPRRRLAQA
jgi:3'-phosphoadenosine 5'-phosphosulfate sulfotransferase (PAPS reductase)/FAD synthetase